MGKTASTGVFDRLSQLLLGGEEQGSAGTLNLLLTAGVALALGAAISTLIIINLNKTSSLEERARMLRMCRKDPSFDRKGCARLLKVQPRAHAKGGGGSGNGGFGLAGVGGAGSGTQLGDRDRLSNLSRKQLFAGNDEGDE